VIEERLAGHYCNYRITWCGLGLHNYTTTAQQQTNMFDFKNLHPKLSSKIINWKSSNKSLGLSEFEMEMGEY